MESIKNIQLMIKIFCVFIFIAILDMYMSTVGDSLFVRSMQVVLRGVLVIPLLFYILKKIVYQMNFIDWICLGIAESLLFYCALSTGTYLSLDFFWIIALVFSTVAITSYSGTIYREKSPRLSRSVYTLILIMSVLISIFSTASNISYWLLGNSNLINPNAVCSISGLYLIFLSFILSFEFEFLNPQKFILKICLFSLFLTTVSSFSRVSLIWICISLIIICKKLKFSKTVKQVFNAILIIFCVFSLFINLTTLAGESENLVELSQKEDIQWRFKGDIGSDFQRLRYHKVILQYLSDDELLTGAGFGVRGYRQYLGDGEDVHNAFLTTLSDSGYLGTYTIIFILCFWPFFRLIIIRNKNNVQSTIFIATIFSSATFFPAPVYGSQYFSIAILYFLFFIKQGITYEHKGNIQI